MLPRGGSVIPRFGGGGGLFPQTDRNETPPGPLPLPPPPGSGFVFQIPVSKGRVEERNGLFPRFPPTSGTVKTGGPPGRLRAPGKAPGPGENTLCEGNHFNGKVFPTLGGFSSRTTRVWSFPPPHPGLGDMWVCRAEVTVKSNLPEGLGNGLKIRDSKHSRARTLPRSLF